MDLYGKSIFQHNRSNSIKTLPIQPILPARAESLESGRGVHLCLIPLTSRRAGWKCADLCFGKTQLSPCSGCSSLEDIALALAQLSYVQSLDVATVLLLSFLRLFWKDTCSSYQMYLNSCVIVWIYHRPSGTARHSLAVLGSMKMSPVFVAWPCTMVSD